MSDRILQRYMGNEICPNKTFNAFPTIRNSRVSKNSFILSFLIKWNNLHSNIRSSGRFALFKKRVLVLITPSESSTFHFRNPKGLKLITRVRLRLSHHRFYKLQAQLSRIIESYVQFWYYRIHLLPSSLSPIISIKRFDVSLYRNCLLSAFIKTFFVHLFHKVFLYFLYLQLLSVDYFVKLFRSLYHLFLISAFVYVCFINLQTSALSFAMSSKKSYLLIDSLVDFCWLIPRNITHQLVTVSFLNLCNV